MGRLILIGLKRMLFQNDINLEADVSRRISDRRFTE